MLAQEGERMRRELADRRGPMPPVAEIERLHAELQELRQAVEELRTQVEALTKERR
jgi:ubiquinone biosynthesis protein UbiJ